MGFSSGKTALAKLLSYSVLALFVGTIGYLFYKNRSELGQFLDTDWRLWAAAFVAYTVTNWLKGYSFVLMLRAVGIDMGFRRSFDLQNLSTLTNYSLPLQGGIGFRVVYMQRVYNLNYKDFLPITLMAFTLATGIYGVLTGIAAVIHGAPYSHLYRLALMVFTAVSAGLIIAPALAPYLVRHHWPFGNVLQRLLKGWKLFIQHRRILPEWVVSVILRAIAVTIVFALACKALQVELDIWQIAVITLAKECSIVVKLTPGALGISEGVVAFFAAIYGVPVLQLILVALGVRLVELAAAGLFGLIAYPAMSRDMINTRHDKDESLAPAGND